MKHQFRPDGTEFASLADFDAHWIAQGDSEKAKGAIFQDGQIWMPVSEIDVLVVTRKTGKVSRMEEVKAPNAATGARAMADLEKKARNLAKVGVDPNYRLYDHNTNISDQVDGRSVLVTPTAGGAPTYKPRMETASVSGKSGFTDPLPITKKQMLKLIDELIAAYRTMPGATP